MLAPTVLVVEDDPELRSTIVRGLAEEGLDATGVATGAEMLAYATSRPSDVLVVDVGLPDADGRDVCQALRAQGIDTPVLFLSARDALTDRLTGFTAGGDDYLTKPFAFAELVARVKALLKRAPVETGLTVGALRLDPVAHAATVDGTRVSLTPTEFRLLARLAGTAGEAVRRRDLVRAAWPHGAYVQENTLDTYVARLRRKLESVQAAPSIRTVHGVGYALE